MEARTTFNTASGVLKTKAEKTEKGWMGIIGAIALGVSCFLNYGAATVTGHSYWTGNQETERGGFSLMDLNKITELNEGDEKLVKNAAIYLIIIAVVSLLFAIADIGWGMLAGGIGSIILHLNVGGLIFEEMSGSHQTFSINDRFSWQMDKSVGYYLLLVSAILLILAGLAALGKKKEQA